MMKILNLEISNFRNYNNLIFFPGSEINVITGKNAVGKTNLIESIYILTFGKSFKTSKNSELINFNSRDSILRCNIENYGYKDELSINLNKDKKNTYYINSEEMNLTSYRKEFSSVIFSPVDINMIRYLPNDRRNYLDNLILKINPSYEHNLKNYKKILFDRNKILKKSINYDLLEIYDIQLSQYGVRILIERLKMIKKFEKYVNKHFFKLSGGQDLKIKYLSSIDIGHQEKEIEKNFRNKLKNNIKKDLEMKFTTVGPHRDDIDFKIEGLSSKMYGSQGEMRTVVLSLKLSEVDILRDNKKHSPILLLDDVFSELDKSRTEYLIKSLNNVQTFITSTNLDEKKFVDVNANFYRIEDKSIYKLIGEKYERK